MTGLLVVSDPKDVLAEGTPAVSGVEIRGVDELNAPEPEARLAARLGARMTDENRSALVAEVARLLRERNVVADVSVPPQEITGGVLQLLVLRGKVGRVKVRGARWSGDSLAAGLGARPGEAVDPERLLADLDWLNRNPFRRVNLVYGKGEGLGETDLTLEATERFPLRVFAGWDDSGTATTGDERLNMGFDWGGLPGDGRLVYQYSTDPDSKWFSAHSASWIQPLPWRHILTALGSYADVHGNVPAPFDLNGFSWQAGVRYEAPLPKREWTRASLRQSLVAGFDFKRSNNNLAFGGQQVFGTQTDGVQWSLGHVSGLKDPWGSLELRVTAFAGPGRWTAGDTDGSYALSRAGARARYVYGKLEASRTTALPRGFAHVAQLTWQESDVNLLPTEQLGLGGYDSIRGYDTRVVSGDRGYIVSNEIRTPPGGVLSRLGARVDDRLQFLGFFDYGSVSNKNLLPGEAARTVLAGAGAGARYTVSSWLSFRADYGWRLRDLPGQRAASSRAHLGLTVSY